MTQLALQKKITEVIDEYNEKSALVSEAINAFEKAGENLKRSATIMGTWGDTNIDTGYIHESTLKSSLLKSAWRSIYTGLNIEYIATAVDKKRFEQSMNDLPEFTIDNIKATFGDYILNPMDNILRGLAEVFCKLDPAYKSHDKVKIGVQGLPKRIILANVSDFGWGKDNLKDIINALAAYQRKALITYQELSSLLKDGYSLLKGVEIEGVLYPARGITLRRFKNGNAHLFFEKDTLWDINKALAQYYGEVLPDCSEEKPLKKQQSTALSKDLQYYPTPENVVERVLDNLYIEKGEKILEPSCGCGRFMDALRKKGAVVTGIEIDVSRANECRKKGHSVLIANFLETVPTPIYDRVVMNPPFYGKHYEKHVKHAVKFLKPGGSLTTILPITARYDHGLLDGKWEDLPVGSFRESGTNINTTILTINQQE